MAECMCWREDWRPLFMPEDSSEARRWPVLAEKVSIWMEEARIIAVAGCKRVREDGPDKCSSEIDSENSDHAEMWTNESMYISDMLDEVGTRRMVGRKCSQRFKYFARAPWPKKQRRVQADQPDLAPNRHRRRKVKALSANGTRHTKRSPSAAKKSLQDFRPH
jgi:hypothetical protein